MDGKKTRVFWGACSRLLLPGCYGSHDVYRCCRFGSDGNAVAELINGWVTLAAAVVTGIGALLLTVELSKK